MLVERRTCDAHYPATVDGGILETFLSACPKYKFKQKEKENSSQVVYILLWSIYTNP